MQDVDSRPCGYVRVESVVGRSWSFLPRSAGDQLGLTPRSRVGIKVIMSTWHPCSKLALATSHFHLIFDLACLANESNA